MKQLRRMEPKATNDAFAQAQRGLFRNVSITEEAFRALERERPELIAVDGDAVLIAEPRPGLIALHYAFADADAFRGRFPALLARLTPALRAGEAPFGMRFRLTDMPSRAYAEPVLRAQAFQIAREWLEMTLPELPDARDPRDDIAPGFLLRPAQPDDADAIASIDEASFPTHYITPDAARDIAGRASLLRVLEDTGAAGEAAGFLILDARAGGTGYISTVALRPEYRRRGLGEATMRWALAWFRAHGLRRAALTVSVDNRAAIALYRKLGFEAGQTGIDYQRPVDDEEARQAMERRQGFYVRVRRKT